MTTSVKDRVSQRNTRPARPRPRPICWSQTGLALTPTVSDHITGMHLRSVLLALLESDKKTITALYQCINAVASRHFWGGGGINIREHSAPYLGDPSCRSLCRTDVPGDVVFWIEWRAKWASLYATVTDIGEVATTTSSAHCQSVDCTGVRCPYGFRTDEQRCRTCECRELCGDVSIEVLACVDVFRWEASCAVEHSSFTCSYNWKPDVIGCLDVWSWRSFCITCYNLELQNLRRPMNYGTSIASLK